MNRPYSSVTFGIFCIFAAFSISERLFVWGHLQKATQHLPHTKQKTFPLRYHPTLECCTGSGTKTTSTAGALTHCYHISHQTLLNAIASKRFTQKVACSTVIDLIVTGSFRSPTGYYHSHIPGRVRQL